MAPRFKIGDTFEGHYEYSLVSATTGIMTVVPDIVRYTVLDVNFAVQGTKRYQNVSLEARFNNLEKSRIVAGFYDRCLRQGQVLEKTPLDENLFKTLLISLNSRGTSLTVKFATNNLEEVTPGYAYSTYTAILPKKNEMT